LAAVATAAACAKLERTSVEYEPDSAAPGAIAQASLFERRDGILLAAPGETISSALADFRNEISGQRVAIPESDGSDKNKKVLGMPYKHEVGDAFFILCLKDIALEPSGAGAVTLDLVINTCGLTLEAHDAKMKLYPKGQITQKPIVLTVNKLALKDPTRADTIRIRTRFQFDAAGALVLDNAELVEGFAYVIDPANYDLDVAVSGVEDRLGEIGVGLNELRSSLVQGLLESQRHRVEQAFRRSLRKGFTTAARRLSSRGRAGLAISGELGGIGFVLGAQPKGFAAGVDGSVGVLAETLVKLDVRPALARLDCVRKHEAFPKPDPVWAGELDRAFAFGTGKPAAGAGAGAGTDTKKPEGGGATTGPLTVQGQAFFPGAFLNALIWRLVGSSGHCRFPVKAESPVEDMILEYAATPSIRIAPVEGEPRRVLLTVEFPAITVGVGRKLMSRIGVDNEPLRALLERMFPRDVEQDVRALTFEVAMTATPTTGGVALALAVDDQERYVKAADPKSPVALDMLAADLDAAFDRGEVKSVDSVLRILGHSVLAQALAPIFAESKLAPVGGDGQARLAGIRAELGALELLYETDVEVPGAIDAAAAAGGAPAGDALALVEGEAETAAGADAGDAAADDGAADPTVDDAATQKAQREAARAEFAGIGESLAALGLPLLPALTPEAAIAALEGGRALGAEWICAEGGAPASVPDPEFRSVDVAYARCSVRSKDLIEVRVIATGLEAPSPEAKPTVVAARYAAEQPTPTDTLKGLDLRKLEAAFGPPSSVATIGASFTAQWHRGPLAIAARGICFPIGKTCSEPKTTRSLVRLDLWLEALP
jgi:hypothetical protein